MSSHENHIGEEEVIEIIRRTCLGGAELTDDCGEMPLPPPGYGILITTDLMESDQHFRVEWHPAPMLARKLLMVNLSDLDASGAFPLGFTLTLAVGPDLPRPYLIAFLKSLGEATHALNLPIIGGDTVGRTSGLGMGITAFGAAKRWLRRDGMQVGDRVYVDQPLGRSLKGYRKLSRGQRWNPASPDDDLAVHLDPRPNLGLGTRLADIPEVHACMDISDGLSRDLRMLARASLKTIVMEPGLESDEIVGGEDYARCFASSLPQAELESRLGVSLKMIGTVRERMGTSILTYDGERDESRLRPLADQSFNHFHRL